MTDDTLIPWGGLACILGGLALGTGVVIDLLTNQGPATAIGSALALTANVLLVLGLTGLYAAQAQRSGVSGRVGYVLSVGGLVLTGPFIWIERFAAVGAIDFARLSRSAPPFVVTFGTVGLLFFVVGFLLFGVATMRAGVLPKWGGLFVALVPILWLASGIVQRLGLAYAACVVVGFAWSGWALWSRKRAVGEHAKTGAPLAMLVLLLATPSKASAQFDVAVAPRFAEADPAVAYNHVDDRFLVVWADGNGDIAGQVRSGDGTVIHDHLRLLGSDRSGVTYSAAKVAFDGVGNLFILATQVTRIVAVGQLEVPQRTIEVAAFDSDGALEWARTVHGAMAPFLTRSRPDLAVGTGAERGALVVWEEGFGSIVGRLLNTEDGTLRGPLLTLVGSSPDAFSPAVTFGPGSFFVAFQVRSRTESFVAGRVVEPASGSIGAEVRIADLTERPRTSRGERFEGGVSVAYNEVSRTYLVAWYSGGAIRARRLNRSPAPTRGVIRFGTPWGPFPRVFFSDVPVPAAPAVAASSVTGHFLVTFANHRLFYFFGLFDGFQVDGWLVDSSGTERRTASPLRESPPFFETGSAFGSSGRTFLVAWDEAEADWPSVDVRGNLTGLPD